MPQPPHASHVHDLRDRNRAGSIRENRDGREVRGPTVLTGHRGSSGGSLVAVFGDHESTSVPRGPEFLGNSASVHCSHRRALLHTHEVTNHVGVTCLAQVEGGDGGNIGLTSTSSWHAEQIARRRRGRPGPDRARIASRPDSTAGIGDSVDRQEPAYRCEVVTPVLPRRVRMVGTGRFELPIS